MPNGTFGCLGGGTGGIGGNRREIGRIEGDLRDENHTDGDKIAVREPLTSINIC